ncbi:MAG: translation initiation factor IF-2 N-terminal domain-containing protein [Syntrophomonadaceae bacterium]
MICIMAGILIAVALYSVNRQKLFMESCSKELKASLLQAQEVKCDLEEMMLNTINMSRELVDDMERRMKAEAEPEPAVIHAGQSMLHEYRAESETGFSKVQPLETRPEVPSFPAGLISRPQMPEKIAISNLFEQKSEAGSRMKTMPAAVFNSLPQLSSAINHESPEPRTDAGATCGPRIHELAEELKTSSKELLNICRQLSLPINHHMKVLSAEQVEAIKSQWFFGEKYIAPPQPLLQSKTISAGTTPEKNEFNQVSSERGQQFSMDEIKQAHPYLAVRTLSEQGYDQKEIARILGRGQSEINLIMNLTKRKMVSNA